MKVESKTIRTLGRFIVSDPDIRQGRPVIRGTRIMASDVLELVEQGISWNHIVDEWRGQVSIEAIAECVRLASQALSENSGRGIVKRTKGARVIA
ncbi:DUF433 domain-containing protein [Sphingobacteriales bacterium CHB3]|nr:DUF433 domain-containing protein [Sphingobacteriales bacterium CHB3]